MNMPILPKVNEKTELTVNGYVRKEQPQDTNIPVAIKTIIMCFFFLDEYWNFYNKEKGLQVDESKKILTKSWFKKIKQKAYSFGPRRIYRRTLGMTAPKTTLKWDNTAYGMVKIDSTIPLVSEWKIKFKTLINDKESDIKFAIGISSSHSKPLTNMCLYYDSNSWPNSTKYYLYINGEYGSEFECHNNNLNREKFSHPEYGNKGYYWTNDDILVVKLKINTKPTKSVLSFYRQRNEKVDWNTTVFDDIQTGKDINYQLTASIAESTVTSHYKGELKMNIISFEQYSLNNNCLNCKIFQIK